MYGHEPRTQAEQAEWLLRKQLQDDLLTFVKHDDHTIGYMLAVFCARLPIHQLERLVDELDTVYMRDGRSILGRKPRISPTQSDKM